MDEEARRQLTDAGVELARLKEELKEERSRGAANRSAKKELEGLRAKLAQLVQLAELAETSADGLKVETTMAE